MKKFLKRISSIVITGFMFCTAVSAENYIKNGIYSFNYERVMDSITVRQMWGAYGVDALQDIVKTATGAAVVVKDGTFIDPESGIAVHIGDYGKISCENNTTVEGAYKRNGNISFIGHYMDNDQIIQLSVKGTLIYVGEKERAGSNFTGTYTANDPGSGRKQIINIVDGLYVWKYEDASDDDFSGWPMIVAPDGSFNYVSEFTTRAVMKGMSETVVTSKTYTNGKFEPDGSAVIKMMTINTGTGQQEGNPDPVIYNAVKAQQNMTKFSDEVYSVLEGKKTKKSQKALYSSLAAASTEKAPEWYTERVKHENGVYSGCAKITSYSVEAAQKLAEATALSQILSYIGTDIEAETTASSDYSDGTGEKSLCSTLEKETWKRKAYRVVKSQAGSDEKTAFVMIEVDE